MHYRAAVIGNTIVFALMTYLKAKTRLAVDYVNSTLTYIVFSTVWPLYVLTEDGDVFVPVRSHLGVHDAKQMEQLMQEPTLVLSPACSLVRHLVGTFEDEFLVLRRRLCLCVDSSTEPWPPPLETGTPTLNSDFNMVTWGWEGFSDWVMLDKMYMYKTWWRVDFFLESDTGLLLLLSSLVTDAL